MMPETVELPRDGRLVTAVVDDSDDCLADIVAAAKEAQRRQRPLELIQAPPQLPITRLEQARRMQQIDTAVHEAREAAPGVDVRLRVLDAPARGGGPNHCGGTGH